MRGKYDPNGGALLLTSFIFLYTCQRWNAFHIVVGPAASWSIVRLQEKIFLSHEGLSRWTGRGRRWPLLESMNKSGVDLPQGALYVMKWEIGRRWEVSWSQGEGDGRTVVMGCGVPTRTYFRSPKLHQSRGAFVLRYPFWLNTNYNSPNYWR